MEVYLFESCRDSDAEFQYGTWWKCRHCERWIQRTPVAELAKLDLPVTRTQPSRQVGSDRPHSSVRNYD